MDGPINYKTNEQFRHNYKTQQTMLTAQQKNMCGKKVWKI